MPEPWRLSLHRRGFLRVCPPLLASFVLATCNRRSTSRALQTTNPSAPTQRLPPTPACGADGFTPAQTAGPFYTPDSPERTTLREPQLTGTPIVLTGQVLASDCTPIAKTLVDFWHANDQGEYDNSGYRLRGHQFTDAEGRYRLETIVPGFYPGRTRHFHVRVQAPAHPGLTTQLYFPDEPSNQDDGLFQPQLLMVMQDGNGVKQARFNFVLDIERV
ncbi:MAG: hypothetical protein AAGE59_35125 [Cyanobacteria bacterium P01_F01_bin.86]